VRGAIAGAQVLMRPSGALWIEGEAMLVVADLHLEKGSAYAARGQLLPPYDTGETLRRLAAEIEALAPRTVVLLGDTLHDGRAEGRIAADDVRQIEALARGPTLVWVVGNHDADGPRRLPGEIADEVAVLGLTLRHEPAASPVLGEVAGHLHPCARVSSRGANVRRRCFVTDGERVVLPAFAALAGGLNIRDPAFRPLFSGPPMAAVLGVGRVHAVGWSSLRND
jgi:DNA ligase-associated metallophosphoesterase